MSEVSFFQHYSKPENHTTNNTLLVLRHFYRNSPRKLIDVLSSLIDEILDIDTSQIVGPNFKQQEKLSQSTPDALISQQPFKIFFEVKGSKEKLNEGQIENHIKSIKDDPAPLKILFALTQEQIPNSQTEKLFGLANNENIVFKAITFNQVLEALRQSCEPHETELQDIIDDYEEYLDQNGLKELVGEIIYIVPVGTSMEENVKFRLYYEPVHRKSQKSSKFFGLYTQKCVRYVGRVNAIVEGRLNEAGKFEVEKADVPVEDSDYKPTDEELQRITDAIDGCSSYYPNLGAGHRFYLFDEFEETEFWKKSKGGLMRGRPRNLSDWLDYDDDRKEYKTAEVAEKLRKREFE